MQWVSSCCKEKEADDLVEVTSGSLWNSEEKQVSNWGGNVSFRCKVLHPRSEAELREILDYHHDCNIRVGGTLHSFNTSCSTDGLLLRLDRFRTLQLEPDGSSVRIGAGLVLREVERFLSSSALTLPVPLSTTTQNVIGAMCHATRGAGGYCLASYCIELKLTSREGGENATTKTLRGEDLQYAACSLGVLGVVSEVVLTTVQAYNLSETISFADDFSRAMQIMLASPRTYVFIWPYVWQYMIAQRDEVACDEPVTRSSLKDAVTDLVSIATVDLLAELDNLSGTSLKILGHAYNAIRSITPDQAKQVGRSVDIVDQKFVNFMPGNLQFEVLMPSSKVGDAVEILKLVVEVFAGTQEYIDRSQPWAARLQDYGLWEGVMSYFGTGVLNVLTYLRLTREDRFCIMSPTYKGSKVCIDSPIDDNSAWYCGFNVEYYTPTDPERFHTLGGVLLPLLLEFCDGRLHWGKYFPLDDALLCRNLDAHPGAEKFLEVRSRFDPECQFLNEHYAKSLGLEAQKSEDPFRSTSSFTSSMSVSKKYTLAITHVESRYSIGLPFSPIVTTPESVTRVQSERSYFFDMTKSAEK